MLFLRRSPSGRPPRSQRTGPPPPSLGRGDGPDLRLVAGYDAEQLEALHGERAGPARRELQGSGPTKVPGEEPQRAVRLERRQVSVLAGVGMQRLLS